MIWNPKIPLFMDQNIPLEVKLSAWFVHLYALNLHLIVMLGFADFCQFYGDQIDSLIYIIAASSKWILQ